MNMPNQSKREVARYDGREVTVVTMTPDEVALIDVRSYAHLIWACLGLFAFWDPTGKYVEYHDRWPGMGPVCLAILEALQLNPNEYLGPSDRAVLTRYESLLDSSVLAARVHAIRKAHNDNTEWFIQTRKAGGYAVRWRGERTWLRIDRAPIPPPASPNS